MRHNTQTHTIEKSDEPAAAETAVDRVIERFGGLTKMARALGAPIPTVQGWSRRKQFPGKRLRSILAAGASLDPPLQADDLIDTAEED